MYFSDNLFMLLRVIACALLLAALALGEDSIVTGTYKGEWSGTSANGEIHVTFKAGADGKLAPEVGFTLGGQDVVCTMISYKIDGAKVTMVYSFDAQGTTLKSAADGTVKGKAIEGTYQTTAGDQAIDNGTWKATIP